jgi:hypothetical protein
VVQIWYVAEDGSAAGLEALIAQRVRGIADPSTPIDVAAAEAVPIALAIDVQTDPQRDTDPVLEAVRAALVAPGSGALEPERLGIGGALFRSAVLQAVLAVPGTVAVRGITLDRAPFAAYGRAPGPGRYFDLAASLRVTGEPDDV